ncbi:MAG: molybdopterin-binding protein, partial [Bacteroidota bacterium]
LSIADFDTMKTVVIEDLKITNQQGELKRTLTQVRGILLKDVLSKVEFIYDKHKELNEIYFLFTAADGYKIVISWNEIFNTDAGNQMYFITEMDGKKLKDLDDKILFVATKDNSLGRRFIKGLKTISVKKAL